MQIRLLPSPRRHSIGSTRPDGSRTRDARVLPALRAVSTVFDLAPHPRRILLQLAAPREVPNPTYRRDGSLDYARSSRSACVRSLSALLCSTLVWPVMPLEPNTERSERKGLAWMVQILRANRAHLGYAEDVY